MHKIINNLKLKISSLEMENFDLLHDKYHKFLYKKGIPSMFINQKTKELFMGIIKGVCSKGNLQIQLEDDHLIEFGLKEISFAKV